MLHIKSLDEGLPIFKALGSEIRVETVSYTHLSCSACMESSAARLPFITT